MWAIKVGFLVRARQFQLSGDSSNIPLVFLRRIPQDLSDPLVCRLLGGRDSFPSAFKALPKCSTSQNPHVAAHTVFNVRKYLAAKSSSPYSTWAFSTQPNPSYPCGRAAMF
jgi:hypothetical protein